MKAKLALLAVLLTCGAAFADSEFSQGAVRGLTQPYPIGVAPSTTCSGGLDQSMVFLTGTLLTCNDPNIQWDYTNNIFKVNESGGAPGLMTQGGGTLAELTATVVANGTQAYCSDCGVGTDPCTGGSSGSEALRLNNRWMCTGAGGGGGGTVTGSGTANVLTMWTGTSSIGNYAVTDDTIPVGNGSTNPATAVPNCTDATGNHLNYTAASNTFSCGTSTSGVTSVAMTVPSAIFGIGGSPVTTTGTLALTVTGTSGGIPYFSSTSALTSSALLPADTLLIGGGAGASPTTFAVTDNTVPVGNGSINQAKAIPDCTDTGGNHLNYTDSTNAFSCGTSGGSVKPIYTWIGAAGCNATTASPVWDLPTSLPAVPACSTGSNTTQGTLQFADGTDTLSAQKIITLATDYNSGGSLAVDIFWNSTTTSGNVVWQVASACVAATETNDPSFNTASTVTDATQGTASRMNTATISALTMTGCAAGELLHLKIFRDPTNGSDTMAGTANLFGVQLTIPKS